MDLVEEQASQLLEAAEKEQGDVERLLEAKNKEGFSVLHLACEGGNLGMVNKLLALGMDAHALAPDGRSILHSAYEGGNLDIIKLFLDLGLDPTATDAIGYTSLHFACRGGHLAAVEMLLADGANYHIADMMTETILHAACRGSLEVVKRMVGLGLDVNAVDDFGRSALHFAVKGKNLDIVEYLVKEHGQDVKAVGMNGITLLHTACEAGSLEIVKFLLERGLDVSTAAADGWTGFHYAIESGNLELAEYLLAADGTTSTEDDSDGQASLGDNVERKKMARIASQLANTTAGTNEWSLLHTAVSTGNLHMVQLLLSLGVDPNTSDKSEWSVLHAAAWAGNLAVSASLLEHGANACGADEVAFSVLHAAAAGGNVDLAKLLLQRGAEAFGLDKHGRTIMHAASQWGTKSMFEFLVQIGLDANATSEVGNTCIHFAATDHKHEMVELLVNHGVDVNARNKNGKTALSLAVQWDKDEVFFSDILQTVHVLMSRGVVYEPLPDDYPEVTEYVRAQAEIIPICVKHWTGEQQRGKKILTRVPPEVFKRGAKAVQTYLSEISASSESELVLRRKVCVIGSSKTGKSSLIRSILTMTPTLVDVEDRTIGVDLFHLDFTEPGEKDGPGKNHQITFWDFAGQDEYQVAHTLFFSRRTLYLLCIDVEVFAQVVDKSRECDDKDEAEAMIDTFVKDRVWRWFRLVFMRQPDAEFVMVATKVDVSNDSPHRVKELEDTLFTILGEYKSAFNAEVDQEVQALQAKMDSPSYNIIDKNATSRVDHLKHMKTRLTESLPTSWLALDVTKANSIQDARSSIEQVVIRSDRSFLMPDKYSRVLERVIKLREEPPHQSTKARIKQLVVPLPELRDQLVRDVELLKPEDCETILETLHDLGDVLWYDRSGLGVLGDAVILSARLLIELVRQIICHDPIKNVKKTRASVRVAKLVENMLLSGQVPHDLVTTFTLWKSLEYPKQVLRFKRLLQHFQLAYPANTTAMEADSDLIVPTFWKLREDQLDVLDLEPLGEKFRSSLSEEAASTVRVFHWEYDFHFEMVETIFEQLAVQSYSVFSKRIANRSCIESVSNPHYGIRLSLVKENGRQIISLEVAAIDAVVAEEYLQKLYEALEQVLEDYPGITVTRYGVNGDGGRERIDQVFDNARAASSARQAVMRIEHEWLPNNLGWYRLPGAMGTPVVPAAQLKRATSVLQALKSKRDLTPSKPSKSWQDLVSKVSARLSNHRVAVAAEQNTKVTLRSQLHTLPSDSFRTEMKAFVKDELATLQNALKKNMDTVGDKLLQTSAGDGNHRDLPALWMVEYVQKPKARLILWILSEISGRCFHKPIEIAVSRQILAKHGDKLQLGLSVFSSVLPDAPVVSIVKSAIDLASPVLSNQVDHARSVHDLLGNLGLSEGGALDTSKQRPVSPAGMYGLLRALLKIHDPDFQPGKICDLANLECGMVLQEGGYRWAHRQELLYEPELYRLRVDYAGDSVNSRSNTGDQLPSPQIEPMYYLSDFRASGLPDDDARLAYCTWELVNRSKSVRVGEGRTIQNPHDGPVQSWWQEAFVVSGIKSPDDLRECELVVEVKRPSKLSLRSDRFVGRGSIVLRSVILDDAKPLIHGGRIVIPLSTTDKSTLCGAIECQVWGYKSGSSDRL
ncbi:hypothetical protein Poli38472_001809 [Pythium oligandrum]|uniref:Non-specific serine/threonine protein kinase n=1 Tax=Pythium oligandrum TaxID=41045 RepID=A0A8K1CWR0_PYTOL|nr:hypothetical protein Poli38472_001809 [Pythium oligandrum]|eukprot:TMW69653.1 hypothetical protein Poli38472_001809 [Pythium oligandrum]